MLAVYDVRVADAGGGAGDRLRAAFDAEAEKIRALAPLDAFEQATNLIAESDLRSLAGDLRAEQALRIVDSGAMSMPELAARIGVSRQAIFYLIKRARAMAATRETNPPR